MQETCLSRAAGARLADTGQVAFKLLALILPLSFDTFAVSAALGLTTLMTLAPTFTANSASTVPSPATTAGRVIGVPP